ncbi:MAG: MFS transporter [Rhodospirillaceae bacterium]|jgi:MFS family permease|nr:MFS transporter [Rhodospirillaceae bacterium]MBT5458549.1 MFS transporter [Rhodospirillaceae bacterium]
MAQADAGPAAENGRWADIFTGSMGIYTLVLGLGMGLFAINQFVVATIMPTILADLGGVGLYTWAFSLFAVGAIMGAASANALRQAFGVRKAYAGAGLALGIGLAGAALAPNMETLVAFRLLQGIGGGAVASQGYGLVAIAYPPHLRSRILGVVSTIWGIATLMGPGFGAAFAESGLWRGAFLGLLPLIVLFVLLAWQRVEGESGDGRLSDIPYRRLALLTFAVFLLSATSLTDAVWLRVAFAITAIAFTILTFRLDSTADRNMFPRGATDVTTELGAVYWILFLGSIVLAIVNTYSTFYLQALHGVSPLVAGYLFAIQSIMWTTSAIFVSMLPRSCETGSIVAGLVFILIGATGIAFLVDSGPVIPLAIAIALTGVGLGCINNPTIQRIIGIVPETEAHMAGASVQAIRNIGISFGAAASGMVAAVTGLAEGAGREAVAFSMSWVYGANAAIAVLALAMVIPMLIARRRAARD